MSPLTRAYKACGGNNFALQSLTSVIPSVLPFKNAVCDFSYPHSKVQNFSVYYKVHGHLMAIIFCRILQVF